MKLFKHRRTRFSAFITMVDLIANALAASLCLFFIITSRQASPKPKEYTLGKLILQVRLRPDDPSNRKLSVSVMLVPPETTVPLFDREILSLNETDSAHQFSGKQAYIQPVNVYRDPSDTLAYTIEINDPLQGLWFIGGMYTDASNFPCTLPSAHLEFKAMFITQKGNSFLTDSSWSIKAAQPTVFMLFPARAPAYAESDN